MSSGAQDRRASGPPAGEGVSCFRLDSARAARLMLVGELDLATAERAREAIAEAQRQTRALTCDLGDVWLIDMSGLRVLLDATAYGRRTGRRFTLASCPPIVPRMLRVLELSDALDVESVRDPAGVPRVFELTDTEARLAFIDP